MKKIGLLVTTVIIGIVGAMSMVFGFGGQTVYAAGNCPEGQVETAILGSDHCYDVGDDGKAGILEILNDVIDFMTVGVGILGVIGITWAGLTYLTAGGREEKVRTAKRRMFEIVIGLAVYVLIYAILKWLLPEFGATTP